MARVTQLAGPSTVSAAYARASYEDALLGIVCLFIDYRNYCCSILLKKALL